MCGLVGMYSQKGEYNSAISEIIVDMKKVISHRGPDDDGTYISDKCCLGFQRLSIIDLNTGHQPMKSDNDRYTIVFNGEIYNYKDLKKELSDFTFKTNSDTEVLLKGYERWGVDVLNKINGIFSIAIYDNIEQTLFLARDHVGVKPLYYSIFNGNLIFSSEIKSILKYPNFKTGINTKKIPQYLNFLWVSPPDTLFDNIFMLEPGHFMIINNDNVKKKKYWNPNLTKEKTKLSLNQYIEYIDNELSSIIKEQMISDVPVGAFLSGGLDSTAIVHKMSELTNHKVKTFTTGFDMNDIKNDVIGSDLYYARLMSKKQNIDYNEIILSPNVVELLPKIIHHMEEPLPDPAAITTFLICKEASKSVKVLLSGVGADEIFGGYPRYLANEISNKYNFIPNVLRKSLIEPLINKIPSGSNSFMRNIKKLIKFNDDEFINRYLGFLSYYTEDELKNICNANFSLQDVFNMHINYYNHNKSNSELTNMMNIDLNTFLPNLNLMYTDKMSSAHSVEVRVPFLDHRFIEKINSMPDKYKIRFLNRKYALKKVFEKYLPQAVVWRKKVGFSAPVGSWINNECKPMVLDLLSEDRVNKRGYFNYKYIHKLLKDQFEGNEYNANQIWQLVCFELWHEQFIDKYYN